MLEWIYQKIKQRLFENNIRSGNNIGRVSEKNKEL